MLLGAIPLEGEEWQPFAMPWDQSPVNLSFLLDAPAGNHGFLDIKEGKFVFQDGTLARFWGTTITGAACFPPQDQAPITAERLSQLGINLVRFQYMDAAWAKISLFTLQSNNKLVLNPLAMSRLDYFLYQLANRGIYAYLDGLDARTLQAGEGLPFYKEIPPGFKGYIHFIPELRDLHKDFLEDFWTHRSEYTQKEYCDTPSIVLTDLFLENDFDGLEKIHPYYQKELELRWQKWCASKKIHPVPPFHFPADTPELQEFFTNLITLSCQDMMAFLRSISVKCPVGSSLPIHSTADLLPQQQLNFSTAQQFIPFNLGKHILIDEQKLTFIDNLQTSNPFSELAFARLDGKPFAVGKWGRPWPNPYRAEFPLWMAAMACFQKWNVCVASTYTSLENQDIDAIQAPLESFNDPCFIGLFPAAALMFYYNEIKPPQEEVKMAADITNFKETPPIAIQDAIAPRTAEEALFHTLASPHPSGKFILSPTQPLDSIAKTLKPAKSFFHDPKRGLVVINTPKCQAVIGQLRQSKSTDLADADIESEEEFGVFCIASIDGKDIVNSKDLWITLISQAQNTGFQSQFVDIYKIMKNPGTGPILIKNTPARLFIHSKQREWTLNSISGGAKNLDSIPFQIQDGVISFRAGTDGTIYYRLRCTR